MQHHRKSPRAQRYDYTSPGTYFITICTKDREHYFGNIEKGIMIENEIGEYLKQEIKNLSEKRKNIEIGEFIIMPNHVHIIITIGEGNNCRDGHMGRPKNELGRTTCASLRKPVSLGQIINVIKGNVTKRCNENNILFARQSRYHDHIVRNKNEYEKIFYYIQNNPKNWIEDKFFT